MPSSTALRSDRADFAEVPPKGWRRLVVGGEIRLRYGYIIRCTGLTKDDQGKLLSLQGTVDRASRGGPGRDVAGRLLDVSESGVGIETYVELPAGARVSFRAALNDGDIDLCFDCSAQVRHCRRLDSGLFRAGLELVNVCWSRHSDALTLIEA